jgi:RNA polymerase sigma-70 factor (ECF subfamily)
VDFVSWVEHAVRNRDGVETRPTIEAFYRDHARDVFAFLVWLGRDRQGAEDLMQDTFVRATRALGGYRGGSPKSWLFAIARSTYLDDVRRRKPTPAAALDEGREDPDVIEAELVRGVLASLPESQRSALVLRDMIGLPYEEIAETLGKSLGATKVLIHRARAGFRSRYEGSE